MGIENTTKKLIRFRTVAGDKNAIRASLRWVSDFFPAGETKKKWFDHPNYPGLLILPKKVRSPDILFVGHIDVVDAELKQFRPQTRGDKLYGRGSFDMKGPVASMMHAFGDIYKEKPDASVGLLVTSDEELGGFIGVGRFVNNKSLLPKIAIVPDGGGEKPFIVASKGKGNTRVIVTVQGKPAHSSRPWEGENAIIKTMSILQALYKKYPGIREVETERTTIVPTAISGKSMAGNVVPHHAEIKFNIRCTSDFDFGKLKKGLASPMVKVTVKHLAKPYNTHLNKPLARNFLKTMKSVLGHSIKTSVFSSTCDARFFTTEGIPVIVTIPTGGGAHGPDEWISAKSLEQFKKILVTFCKSYG